MKQESTGLMALRKQKRQSVEQTRTKLEATLSRLISEMPSDATAKKLSATSVAEAAGVNRVTLYRFHQPVLAKIRDFNTSSSRQQCKKISFSTSTQEYRAALEEAQREVTALARINYRQAARISELEAAIRVREERISQLQKGHNIRLLKNP